MFVSAGFDVACGARIAVLIGSLPPAQRPGRRAGADTSVAWQTLLRTMIETGATKPTLASTLDDHGRLPHSIATASNRLKAAVAAVLLQAQEAGVVRPSVTVEEVYLLIRGVAQASATMPVQPATLDHAIGVVLTGLSR